MGKPTVGWIGLGIMGKPMARNLMRAGFPLVAHNRSRAPVDELVAEGAAAAATPSEVAELADVVVTMLPDSPDVEAVVLGPGGVLSAFRAGTVFVDMSTIAPAVARRIAAEVASHGGTALDAPVSGGDVGAIAGTLSIMVGGAQETFERMKPLFDAMGKNVVWIGEAGAGQIAKACNQIVVALTIEAVAEALALAQKSGADPARVRQALLGGSAQSRILEVHGQRMLDGNYKPGFKSVLQRKDLRIDDAAAREAGLDLPGARLALERFDQLVTRGDGELDHSALRLLL